MTDEELRAIEEGLSAVTSPYLRLKMAKLLAEVRRPKRILEDLDYRPDC